MTPGAAERMWRVRKHHTWIDAHVRASGASRFELLFHYDGALVLNRAYRTREDAVAQAGRQLRELERAGWNTHW
jgi:hypothetical protein